MNDTVCVDVQFFRICIRGSLGGGVEKNLAIGREFLFLLCRPIHSDDYMICFHLSFRDYLFRLSLDGLALLEESSWPAADEVVRLCQDKGQSEDDCHNYIRVLHIHGTELRTPSTGRLLTANFAWPISPSVGGKRPIVHHHTKLCRIA